MSQGHHISVTAGGAAMTFRSIAEELGWAQGLVEQIYKDAMRKLRQSGELARLYELASELARIRESKMPVEVRK